MAETVAQQQESPQQQGRDIVDRLYDDKVVTILGTKYTVRNPDALAFLDYVWITKKSERALELFGLIESDKEPTAEESAEMSAILDRFVRIVLDAPPQLIAALTDTQRFQIMAFFGQSSRSGGQSERGDAKRSASGRRQARSGKRARGSVGKKRSRG